MSAKEKIDEAQKLLEGLKTSDDPLVLADKIIRLLRDAKSLLGNMDERKYWEGVGQETIKTAEALWSFKNPAFHNLPDTWTKKIKDLGVPEEVKPPAGQYRAATLRPLYAGQGGSGQPAASAKLYRGPGHRGPVTPSKGRRFSHIPA